MRRLWPPPPLLSLLSAHHSEQLTRREMRVQSRLQLVCVAHVLRCAIGVQQHRKLNGVTAAANRCRETKSVVRQ